MSCEKPRRQPTVNLLSAAATREFTNSLARGEGEREIEFVVAVRRDGDLDYYIPNKLNIGDTLVQTNTCNGTCVSYEVSTRDPRQGGSQFIVEKGFTRRNVSCDDGIVKQLTTGRVVTEIQTVAFALYKDSGCACSSGSCLHM